MRSNSANTIAWVLLLIFPVLHKCTSSTFEEIVYVQKWPFMPDFQINPDFYSKPLNHEDHILQFRSVLHRASSSSFYDICVRSPAAVHCVPHIDDTCFTNKNCPHLMIWSAVRGTDKLHFQVLSVNQRDKRTGQSCQVRPRLRQYLSVGFSIYHSKTKEKLVIQCSFDDTGTGSVKIASSVGDDYRKWDIECSNKTEAKLSDCVVEELPNNQLKCEFKLKKRTVLQSVIFELNTKELVIHLASGCDISDLKYGIQNGGRYESIRIAKSSFRTTLKLCHGCLMIVAFCVFIPNGVFLSRYFKESFVEASIAKRRLWFVGHAFFQSFATLLAGVATVLAVIKNDIHEFFQFFVTVNLHKYLGIVTLLCLVLQQGTGWINVRQNKLKRILACFHLLVGTLCYTISYVTIGISSDVGMSPNIKYFIIVAAGWTFIWHVVMCVHFNKLDKYLGLLYSRAFYPFPIPPVTNDAVQQGSRLRLAIFAIHFLGSMFLATAMIYQYIQDW